MKRNKITAVGLCLLAAPCLMLAAGCGRNTTEAAPPPGPNAHPLPPVQSKYPHPKLPPLVGPRAHGGGGGI